MLCCCLVIMLLNVVCFSYNFFSESEEPLNTSSIPLSSLESALRVFRSSFEKHLSRSKVPFCSRDVQQEEQQTGARRTGIDTQLGVSVMSWKAAFSLFCLACLRRRISSGHSSLNPPLSYLKFKMLHFQQRKLVSVCVSGGSVAVGSQVWSLHRVFYSSLSSEMSLGIDLWPLTPPATTVQGTRFFSSG